MTSKAFALFNGRAWKEGPLIHYAGSILLYEMDFKCGIFTSEQNAKFAKWVFSSLIIKTVEKTGQIQTAQGEE